MSERAPTPQRAARRRSTELREQAAQLRAFVTAGKVETYRAEARDHRGKLKHAEGLKTRGINDHEGRRIIQEAERLELLADLTLEGLGITDKFDYETRTNTDGEAEPEQPAQA
jgi:hypothetical protein